MTERTYKCNFCRETIRKEDDGVGTYWNGGWIDSRALCQCENHLCKSCLRQIGELYVRTLQDQEPKP